MKLQMPERPWINLVIILKSSGKVKEIKSYFWLKEVNIL